MSWLSKKLLVLLFIIQTSLLFAYLYYTHPYYEPFAIAVPEVALEEKEPLRFNLGLDYHRSFTKELDGYYHKKYSIPLPQNSKSIQMKYQLKDRSVIRYINEKIDSNNININLNTQTHLILVHDLKLLEKVSIPSLATFDISNNSNGRGIIYIYIKNNTINLYITNQIISSLRDILSIRLLKYLALPKKTKVDTILQIDKEFSNFEVIRSSPQTLDKIEFALNKKTIAKYNNKEHNIWMLLCCITVSLLLTFIVYELFYLKKYKSIILKIFLCNLIFWGLILYIIYPGYETWDNMPDLVERYQYTTWYSFFYWIITKFSLFLGGLHIIVLCNIILISIITTYAIMYVYKLTINKYIKVLLYTSLVFMLNPFFISHIFTLQRIYISSLFLIAGGIIFLYYINIKRNVIPLNEICISILFIAIASCMRIEYIFFSFISIIVLYIRYKKKLAIKNYVFLVGSLCTILYLFHNTIPSYLLKETYKAGQKMYLDMSIGTAFAPFMYNKEFEPQLAKLTNNKEAYENYKKNIHVDKNNIVGTNYFIDNKLIGKYVIDYRYFFESYPFFNSSFTNPIKTYLTMILNNPIYWFNIRWGSIQTMVSHNGGWIFFALPVSLKNEEAFRSPHVQVSSRFGWYSDRYNAVPEPFILKVEKQYLKLRHLFLIHENFVIFLSYLALFFIFISFFLTYKYPYVGLLNIGILLKFGIFFALSPASYPLYLFDFTMWGLLLPILILFEHHHKEKNLPLTN